VRRLIPIVVAPALLVAGFPIELIEEPGGHSDSHTDPDLLAYLLPHIDDGWLAP
jgi:hypothetical protein